MKSMDQKRREAVERQKVRDARTPAQQICELAERQGGLARKELDRLCKLLPNNERKIA